MLCSKSYLIIFTRVLLFEYRTDSEYTLRALTSNISLYAVLYSVHQKNHTDKKFNYENKISGPSLNETSWNSVSRDTFFSENSTEKCNRYCPFHKCYFVEKMCSRLRSLVQSKNGSFWNLLVIYPNLHSFDSIFWILFGIHFESFRIVLNLSEFRKD